MTFDIYNNRIPCGLLKPLEIIQFEAHNGDLEVFNHGDGQWSIVHPVSWCRYSIYRAVRPAITKPSINWDHVAPKWKWLARDNNGEAFIYNNLPSLRDFPNMWSCTGDMFCIGEILSSYTPGNCDWHDSLVMRPGADQ